jgi:GNAT superfamily N-acetyltransferase
MDERFHPIAVGDDLVTVETSFVDPDRPEVVELLWEMRREFDRIYGEVTTDPPPKGQFSSPRAAFLVVRYEGRLVACGAFRPWDEGTAEVKRVFVTPTLRRRGIGRLMMDKLEGQARRLGYRRMFLETGDRQSEAMEMYISLGYRRVPCHGDKQWKGYSVCMEKTL